MIPALECIIEHRDNDIAYQYLHCYGKHHRTGKGENITHRRIGDGHHIHQNTLDRSVADPALPRQFLIISRAKVSRVRREKIRLKPSVGLIFSNLGTSGSEVNSIPTCSTFTKMPATAMTMKMGSIIVKKVEMTPINTGAALETVSVLYKRLVKCPGYRTLKPCQDISAEHE